VVERGAGFFLERVSMRGNDQDGVDEVCAQDVRDAKNVGDVGRIEAAPEDRDGAAGVGRQAHAVTVSFAEARI
jgi:hypothetical protein